MALESSQEAITAVRDAAATLEEASKATAEDATETTTSGLADAKSVAVGLASKVADGLRGNAETQKNAGAEAIASFARSAREAAKDLNETSPQVARLMLSSADAVERLGNNLRAQSLSEIAHSLDGFAMQRPVAFLGCGVLAGIILGRLFTSSSQR